MHIGLVIKDVNNRLPIAAVLWDNVTNQTVIPGWWN